MAKRRRLTDAEIAALTPGGEPAPETKSMPRYPLGVAPAGRPPIAQVAGEAAAQAALDEVAGELKAARDEGRMVLDVPLQAIDATYLVRDRIAMDPEELDVLIASLRDRGQQMPLEITDLGAGRYGLISGWRRLTALRQLEAETGEARFLTARCLVRDPKESAAAYRAMVEENEIRAPLGFYERARIAVRAVEEGAFPTRKTSVKGLFAAVSASKRSKIRSFITVYDALDPVLTFPGTLPERVGLAMAAALEADPGFADRLKAALASDPLVDAAAERKAIDAALRPVPAPAAQKARTEIAPGVFLKAGARQVVLSGPGVTPGLCDDLRQWLAQR